MTTTIVTGLKNRRRTRRFTPRNGEARVEFSYPKPGGRPLSMRVKDISAAGFCFELERELPGLEVGQSIDRVTLFVHDSRIRGDLLVMHITPDLSPGSICGALFYPDGDAGLLAMQALLADLEQTEASARR